LALDLGELLKEAGDALGLNGGLVVHAPGAERAGPQGAAVLVGDDGGLRGVLLFLARDEGAAAGLAGAGAPDLHFGAVQAQGDAAFGGVGEHVGQGLQPDAGLFGHGEPAGGQQRADLPDRPADRGAVHPVQDGKRSVRELKPQVNQGRDDPVGKRQVVAGARAGGPLALVSPPAAQPVLPGSHPGTGELLDELGQPAAAEPGQDTMRQGRAGPS